MIGPAGRTHCIPGKSSVLGTPLSIWIGPPPKDGQTREARSKPARRAKENYSLSPSGLGTVKKSHRSAGFPLSAHSPAFGPFPAHVSPKLTHGAVHGTDASARATFLVLRPGDWSRKVWMEFSY